MIKHKARIASYITASIDGPDILKRLMFYKIKKRMKAEVKRQHFAPFGKLRLEAGMMNDDFIHSSWTVVAKVDGYFKLPFMHRDYNRTKNRKSYGFNATGKTNEGVLGRFSASNAG